MNEVPAQPAGVPGSAFIVPISVSDEDVDIQGHVSNVEVVRWISRAAWAHSVSLGYDMGEYERLGAWFVVRRHEVDYMMPARAGDALLCYTWPSGIGKVTAERRHVIVRRSDGAEIARAVNTWAFIGIETSRPVRIPEEVARAFDPGKFR